MLTDIIFNAYIVLHFIKRAKCIMYTLSLIELKVTKLNEKIARIKRR